MAEVQVFCFLASYTVAFCSELTRLLRTNIASRYVSLIFAYAGCLAHFLYLLNRSQQTNLPPLLSSTHEWILVLAWLAILMYLFVSTRDQNIGIGLFLLPLVLLLVIIAVFVSHSPNTFDGTSAENLNIGTKYMVFLHVTLLVFGMAGVLVGIVLSLMYMVQHYRLKHKQTLQSKYSLPSLERLMSLNWWAITISIPLLAAGMFNWSDPVILIYLIWLAVLLACLVWINRSEKTHGKHLAIMTLLSFGFLVFTIFGLQILTGKGILHSDHSHHHCRPVIESLHCDGHDGALDFDTAMIDSTHRQQRVGHSTV